MYVPTQGMCYMYGDDAWTSLGETAEGGRTWRDNVMDDLGCYECP